MLRIIFCLVILSAIPTFAIADVVICNQATIKEYGDHCGQNAQLDDPFQCTTYVKQKLPWVGKLGTYLSDKQHNPYYKDKNKTRACIGGVAVMKTGVYGHVGIVRADLGNQITIEDRNYCCDGQLHLHDVSVSIVTGYICQDASGASSAPFSGACPSGNGLYCGDSGKGQNTNYLYQCTNGVYKVSLACSNGCQQNSAGKIDNCKPASSSNTSSGTSSISAPKTVASCPSGNGLYCGDLGKGQNASNLYQCTNGVYKVSSVCSNGCQQNSAGKSDSCKASSSSSSSPISASKPVSSCPSGNGLYCGDSGKGQNASYLYQCTNGVYTAKSACSSGCQKNGGGKDDSCKSSSNSGSSTGSKSKTKKCPNGNGLYCGNKDLGQNENSLYKCTNGEYEQDKKCSKGCKKSSAGKDDVCK
jgi:hypothetical protein